MGTEILAVAFTIALTIAAWLLFRWRRRGVPDAVVLGRYHILAGAVRFGIEFKACWRRYNTWNVI